jgi:hypothetical protein
MARRIAMLMTAAAVAAAVMASTASAIPFGADLNQPANVS